MRAILFCLALLALGAHSAKAETFADVNRILDKEYGWQFKSVPAAVQGMDFNCNFQNRKPSGSVQFSPICVGNKTGLRLIVPDDTSALKPEDIGGAGVEFMTLSKFREWLARYGLSSS